MDFVDLDTIAKDGSTGDCQRSIVNHIYWSAASTPDGDGTRIVAKYKSILNHVRNIHTGHGHERYNDCQHDPIVTPACAWLKQERDPKTLDSASIAEWNVANIGSHIIC